MMKRRTVAMMLGATMLVSNFSCLAVSASEGNDQANAAVDVEEMKKSGLSDMFPLEEPVTLTYYIRENGAMSATMESYADVEFFKELEELTNVHIEWNHNTSNENFALMIASGQLPDMINWNLGNAAGGVEALLEDGVIMDLTELMPEYAPNYYAWMQANPEEDKAFKTDSGNYYQFVNFNANWDDLSMVYFKILGPQIRKDWLDKLGLDMPTTTDELYEVLKAFKENDMDGDGDLTNEIPMAVVGGEKGLTETMYTLAGSFGTRNDFQMMDGEIVYGPITDNFKEYLTYMHKLYSEGLINSDFAVNTEGFDSVVQGTAGFAINSMGSGLIATRELLKSKDPDSDYVSVPWLIGPHGDQCLTTDSNVNPRGTAITTACENPEIALAWLDYAYSYAGSMASTYGIEGKSYEFVDGEPTILDAVKQNDNGWSEEQSISRWMLGSINYPNARDKHFYEQINLNEDYKVEIQTNWNLATGDITLPPLILTTEESNTYSNVMADLSTYVSECLLKFIVGDMDLEKDWDTYVANVEGMDLEKALECKKAAYERYQSR